MYKTLIKQGLNGHPGAKGEPGISKINLEKTVRSIFKEMMKGFFHSNIFNMMLNLIQVNTLNFIFNIMPYGISGIYITLS